MPLDTQVIPIRLGQGLDTKSDPRQIQAGKLTALENGVFTPGNEIVKRPGFSAQPASGTPGVAVTVYNNQLITLDGQSLWSLSSGQNQFNNKGSMVLTNLQTTTIVRNTHNQSIADSAISGAYLCYAWIESQGTTGIGSFYSIFDSVTGQPIVASGTVNVNATLVKTLSLGTSFFIIYFNSTANTLEYRAVPIGSPATIGAAGTIATDVNTTTPAFDAEVFNSLIYVAYPNNTGTKASVYNMSVTGSLSSQANVNTTVIPNVITVFGDSSNNAWVGYSKNATASAVYGFALNSALSGTVLVPTAIGTVSTNSARNITGYMSASNTATFYYEMHQTGSYVSDPLTPNLIYTNTLTSAGVIGTQSVFIRGSGIASKVFTYNSIPYFWSTTQSPLQNSYFLLNGSATVCAKLSPGVGGGYLTNSPLPEVNNISTGVYQTASLIKDNLTAISGTVYTQTGVTSAKITFTSTAPSRFTLGANLHVAGGILQMYDGANVVEHGYSIYPEGLSGSLSFAPSATNGTVFSDIVLPPVMSFNGSISSSNSSQWQYASLFEWTDNQGQLHRSAPSVPLTVSAAGYGIVSTLVGGTAAGGTVTFSTVSTNVSVGMYTFYIAAIPNAIGTASTNYFRGYMNNTIASISGNVVTFNNSIGTNTASSIQLLVSSYPFGWLRFGLPFTNGSTANFSSGAFSNIAVGQTILPSDSGGLFPPNTYITAISGSAGGGGTVTVTFSNSVLSPNYETTGNYFGSLLYYSVDIASATITSPTLKQTAKANVDVALYRTQLNQTLFYRQSSPTILTYNNKTIDSVSFSDSTVDALIIGNEQLYTTGGEIENIEVPASSVATTFKSRPIVVPSENPLSWWYGKQVIPGVPAEFTDSFVNNADAKIGSITAVGTLDEKIILFGPGSKFYVVGDGPAPSGLNNDFTYPQKITGNTGCANQASILEIPVGLLYQDMTKGIHLLDRSLQEQYIGADVEQYNTQIVTSAHSVPGTKMIRMTLDNGVVLTYDYFYNQWGADQYASSVVDSTIYNNQFTWIPVSGTAFSETSGTWSDNGAFIPMSLTTGWMNLAAMQGFMRVKKLMILGTYFSPHILNVNVYTDYNDTTPVQTRAIPVLTAPNVYQYVIVLSTQKCEAIKLQIYDTQVGAAGQSFSLSSLAFEVGIKKGTQKLSVGQEY